MEYLKLFKNFIFFAVIFYILVILKTVLFDLSIIILVLTLILFILINMINFSKEEKIFASFILGFYLDVFSLNDKAGFFGFFMIILLSLCFLFNFVFDKYIRINVVQKR